MEWVTIIDVAIPQIARELQLTQGQVQATVGLLDDGATVPFISRYRKEATASLVDMARQLESDRGALAALTLKIDAANARLGTLRAEAKEHQDLVADAAPSYRTTTRARVRAAPTTESQEVALMPAGTLVVVLDSVGDGTWYRVGRVGFMHRDLLEPAPAEQGQ